MTIGRTSPQMSAAIIKCLMLGPKSRKQICIELDVALRRSTSLNKYIEAYMDSGIVYITGWTEMKRPIFALQPTPFEMPDAPRPENKHPKRVLVGQRLEERRAATRRYNSYERLCQSGAL